jgi:hypothetical protein
MIRRIAYFAAFAALLGFSAPQAANAQGGRLPLFQVAQWNETEDGGWSGVWTFDTGAGRRSMSAVWTNQQTGRHRRADHMAVSRRGQQIIISRPGLGNYVGTISPDGSSLQGTLSWSQGHFRAYAAR